MTARDEGHVDMSGMQVQVLRSTFCLMILAVAILVIFSSVAVLRNPKLSPMVNVLVDWNPGAGDQSTRLRRGAEDSISNDHMHAPYRHKVLYEGNTPGHGKYPHGKHRENKTQHGDKHEILYGNKHGTLRGKKDKMLNGKSHEPRLGYKHHFHTNETTSSNKNKHHLDKRKHFHVNGTTPLPSVREENHNKTHVKSEIQQPRTHRDNNRVQYSKTLNNQQDNNVTKSRNFTPHYNVTEQRNFRPRYNVTEQRNFRPPYNVTEQRNFRPPYNVTKPKHFRPHKHLP